MADTIHIRYEKPLQIDVVALTSKSGTRHNRVTDPRRELANPTNAGASL
jgi:hypothetical protein